MKLLQLICFCLLLQFSSKAQDQNHLFTNISYAFFGTGDLQGTAIGIDYHRTLWKRLGFHLGYSKATGQGDRALTTLGNIQNTPINATFTGSGNYASDIANYQTYLLGLNYKVTAGNRQALFVSGGLNYKKLTYNYLGNILSQNINSQGEAEQITIRDFNFVADREAGFYLGLDYLFILDNSVSFGLHLAVEDSNNIVSKAGLSLGFRF